jgi:DNA-binding NarL/FixJ family response regulator
MASVDLQYDPSGTQFQNNPSRLQSACRVEVNRHSDQVSEFGIGFGASAVKSVSIGAEVCRIAWVDSYRLTRECIMKAFVELYPHLVMFPFASAQDCIDADREELDLIIYHSHKLDAACLKNIAELLQVYEGMPLMVLLDDDEAQQIRTMPDALKSGARGFISTQTADIPMALAAMRFVKAGGTFAPRDLLMTRRVAGAAEPAEPAPANQLTPRQTAVFLHVKEGKANKVIAHELGMSESTVKVHVRNIMRKMGATNRTQAVFKARSMGNDFGDSRSASM